MLLADYNLAQRDEVRGSLRAIGFVLAAETGEDEAPSVTDFEDALPLAAALADARNDADCRLRDPGHPLQIIYTSGTTGDPKSVVMDNCRFGLFSRLGEMLFGFRKGDIFYTGLSLTHGNAQAVTLGNALGMGLPAVISRRFTKSRLLDICRKHGCITFSLLGGMATAVYSEPEEISFIPATWRRSSPNSTWSATCSCTGFPLLPVRQAKRTAFRRSRVSSEPRRSSPPAERGSSRTSCRATSRSWTKSRRPPRRNL